MRPSNIPRGLALDGEQLQTLAEVRKCYIGIPRVLIRFHQEIRTMQWPYLIQRSGIGLSPRVFFVGDAKNTQA